MLYRWSLLLSAPRTLVWVEEPLPPPGPHEIVVQTRVSAISIGTELPLYCGTHRGSELVPYPKMTGYENVATVIACGAAVHHLAVGDRVVAFYGHRTHAVLPAHKAIVVPPSITDAQVLQAILACDTAKGVAKANAQPHEPVLITGAGTIGLLTLFNLRARSIEQVDMIEPNEYRRAVALRWGARSARDPAEAALLPSTYAIGFECSSHNQAFQTLQHHLARNGRVCILADGNIEPLVLAPAFHEKELHVGGSSDGDDYHGYARWFFQQIQGGWAQVDQLFEWHIPAHALPQAFAQLARAHANPLKVLVHYDGTPRFRFTSSSHRLGR